MHRLIFVAMLSLPLVSIASAQQLPDPALMARIIGSLQTQRNAAQDSAAVAEARAAGLADDLAKAQARVKELENKYEPKKEDEPKKE